jgi:peptide/nickel transport system substrate-binding protein
LRKLRWQLLIIFITGLAVGILLLGEQPGVQTLLSTPEPVKGGVYTEALIGSFQRLNPALDYYNQPDRDIDRLLYSSLIRFDSNGQAKGDLAESWGVSKDGTIYNFALRQNIKWHNGRPLTSQDILYTIELLRSGGSAVPADIQSFWREVDVKALNETTLQFRLPEPFAPFPDFLTFGILPAQLLGGQSLDDLINSTFNLQPVGSGPYRFEKLIVTDDGKIGGVSLVVFEEYYGKKPFIERIVFRYYPTSSAAYKAYKEGVVMGIGQVTSESLSSILADPNLSIHASRLPEMSMILLNLKNTEVGFFQETAVRKALLMGINRQYLIDRIFNGQAIIAHSPFLPGTWSYYDKVEQVKFDLETARNMLKDAGYVVSSESDIVRKKKDVSLAFKLVYPDTKQHKILAEAIKKNWDALNIGVELEALPYEELITNRLETRTFQAALVDFNMSRSPDPDPYPFWDQAQSTGGQNYSQWENQSASDYLEQARVSTDQGERVRLYRNFQITWAKELPALPLFYPVYTFAVDRQIQGIQFGPIFGKSDRFDSIMNWYLLAKRVAASPSVVPTK